MRGPKNEARDDSEWWGEFVDEDVYTYVHMYDAYQVRSCDSRCSLHVCWYLRIYVGAVLRQRLVVYV